MEHDTIKAMRKAMRQKLLADTHAGNDELWQAALDADPLRVRLGREAVEAIMARAVVVRT